MGKLTAAIRVADEVWIGAALLHHEHPHEADFTLKAIEARIRREALTAENRPGVYPHISTHCVANRPPSPGIYRVLFETGPSRRRLFRPGDPYHPGRDGGKTQPERAEIPEKYHYLLDWYDREWAPAPAIDALQSLANRYRDLWKGAGGDRYVEALREGFE